MTATAPSLSGSPGWFLAQVKPNSHQIALRNLKRQGFKTFLPLQEETIRHKDRFVARMRPLFPGYLFVMLDLAKGQWRAVNSTYGLTGLVRFGAQPSPVPADLVGQLAARCDTEGRLVTEADFAPGDQVTLTRGPFADFVATVECISPNERVSVLMGFMGKQTRLDIPTDHLRPSQAYPWQ